MTVYKEVFTFQPPAVHVTLTKKVLRETLASIRDMLLVGEINGGKKKLQMDYVCDVNKCGTAACIGGWAGILLANHEQAHTLMDYLCRLDRNTTKGNRLHELFYAFAGTEDYDEPNVAATAIQRYLDGKRPWPGDKMPNRLRYRYKRKAA